MNTQDRPFKTFAACLDNGPLWGWEHRLVVKGLDIPEAVFGCELFTTFHVQPPALHCNI
eukprot:CAMPEP_0115872832 /NCGR_PEP_ID=MMETSP0287-20121206/23648_1 /TAXON_ID=412157 /ORGANISM="Chrysochromulina rotalis, Strain UIO044" /LENGTH=58 /DNA_ID=CAMNT_0003327803 /DNA_START=255 /DNA_END=431 /DNA_ORIENTATION=+